MAWLCVCVRVCVCVCVCVQFHRYIEIAIKQCRSSGIDCKIHGLAIVGRIRAEDEDLATVPFLASDNEEEEDEKTATGRCVCVCVCVCVSAFRFIYVCFGKLLLCKLI